MSLFNHIKKMQENKPPVSTPNEPLTPTDLALDANETSFEAEPSIAEVIDTLIDQQTPSETLPAEKLLSAGGAGQHFYVGIDLGTTHCVLSYAQLDDNLDEFTQQVMAIPQLSAPGMVENSHQLPSFLYQAHDSELPEGSVMLPWTARPHFLVGEIARNLGSKTPIRLISSAKSWLCHAGVDCKSAILPMDAPEEVIRVSPFQATVAYLQHLSDAWHYKFPNAPLAEQELVITVPASFDPAARELTIEAAREVGLHHAILLEEPQAAVYSWIEKSQGEWRKQTQCGDVILVVDIGGGTTDLSLIAVTQQHGTLELTRVAVGDHILLGGDNMDLALAYTVKAKVEQSGQRLPPWQVNALTHSCREAKEKLFTDSSIDTVPIVVANRGSSLVGGSLRTELTREEVERVLVEGFLPKVTAAERPVLRPRSGLRSAGLPYAQDAGITRHLAAFLAKQQHATQDLSDITLPEHASFLHPTAVLFNGGVLKAEALAERLMIVLNSWLVAEGAPEARLLSGAELDLAVARGAAYYGFVRKGKGVRIKGGTAASYYVGVESAMPAVPGLPPELEALCIAPFGMEEGTQEELPDDEFGLVIGEPVRFRFFASTTRRDDFVGMRLDYWTDEELAELAEIEIILPVDNHRAGDVVPVHLCAAVTEVGTLELNAVSQRGEGRWKIEFDVRAGEA
ncbi:MAG: Hsp70 family protein [Methylovulum sp.]|jgi:hypothetical protein